MNVNRDYESLFLPCTKSIKKVIATSYLTIKTFSPKIAVLYLGIVSLHPTILSFFLTDQFTSRISIIFILFFPPEILDT